MLIHWQLTEAMAGPYYLLKKGNFAANHRLIAMSSSKMKDLHDVLRHLALKHWCFVIK